VHAIVRSTPGLAQERARRDAHAAAQHQAQAARAAAQAAADLQAAALAWSQRHVGDPLADGAATLGIPAARLRALLGNRGMLHPPQRARARQFSDEELLQRIQEWVDVHGLSGAGYRAAAQGTEGWPSYATIRTRFGTWRKALVAAGFTPPPFAGGPPVQWTDDQLIAVVSQYFSEPRRWSRRDLAAWLQADPARPSQALITKRLGLWPALTRLATHAP